MYSTVYLVRNAQTAWNDEGRLAGRRELPLSEKGRASAERLVSLFAGVHLDELLSSPLPRALETATPLGAARGLEVARDPRLSDWLVGDWEGRTYAEIMKEPRYTSIVGQPTADITLPGGEPLSELRARMRSSVDQALSDNELGCSIAFFSHAGPLRILLSDYLSLSPWDHDKLRLDPGSVTVLRFASLTAPPTLLLLNATTPLLDTLSAAG